MPITQLTPPTTNNKNMGTRFSRFGLVINPQTDEKINWLELNQSEIVSKFRELKFLTKTKLETILIDLEIDGQPKKGALATDKAKKRYSVKVVNYGGQLEAGRGGTPHWQLWVETKPQTTKQALLRALSKAIYDCDNSTAISLQQTGMEDAALKQYCLKQGRLELEDEYTENVLDKKTHEYIQYLKENPELKKLMTARGLINDSFFNF